MFTGSKKRVYLILKVLAKFLIYFHACTFILIFPDLLSSDGGQKLNSFSQSDSLIGAYQQVLIKDSANTEKRLNLIQLFLRTGDWENAEQEVEFLLQQTPGNLDLLFLLGRIYQRTYRFLPAENIFRQTLQQKMHHRPARLAMSDLYIIKKNVRAADSLLSKMLEEDSLDSQVLRRKADIAYLHSRTEDARHFYTYAMQVDSNNSMAYLGLAQIFFDESVLDSSKKYAKKALDNDFFNPEAHSLLGYIYFREGNISGTGDELRLALKCDNFSIQTHRLYGRGITDQDYKHFRYPDELEETDKETGITLQKARSAFEQTDYQEAKIRFEQLTKTESAWLYGWLGMGSIQWQTGELDQSLLSFNEILVRYPGYGTAHNGIYRVLATKIDLYANDHEKSLQLISQIPRSDNPYLPRIFTNFASIPPSLQKAILLSIAPLSKYLEALNKAGATFYIVPLHEKLTDAQTRKFLRGIRTFDLRLWDDIRGNGGLHASSGIGSCWDALHFKFNEIAHEFAHQVHIYALTREEKKEIGRLFFQALEQNRCLDVYARSDEFEYFAVGVEAYVSKEKRLDQKLYYGHTRDELTKRDPKLLDFIEQLIRKDNINENILSARTCSAEDFINNGQFEEGIIVCQKILQEHPSFVPAFHALVRAFLHKENFNKAIDFSNKALKIDKNDGWSWKLLANSEYLRTGNLMLAQKIIEEGLTYDSTSAELCFELAKIEHLSGDLATAGIYYSRAAEYKPTFYEAASGAAYCLFRRGYHKEAEDKLTGILQQKKLLSALMVYGELQLKRKNFTSAQRLFQTAADIDPENPEILSFLHLLQYQTGDTINGIEKQFFVADSNKGNLKILNNLLHILYQAGWWNATEKYLEHGNLLLTESGKRDQRSFNEEDLYQNQASAEQVSDFYYYKGRILARTGHRSDALVAFKKSINVMPENFDSYTEMIWLLNTMGDKKQSELYLKRLRKLQPGPFYQN